MVNIGQTIGFCGVYDPDLITSRLRSGFPLQVVHRERVDELNDAGEVDVCEWRFSLDGLSQRIDLVVDDDGSATLELDRLSQVERRVVLECLFSDPELQSLIVV